MTTFENGEKPDAGTFVTFDYVKFIVGNAKQESSALADLYVDHYAEYNASFGDGSKKEEGTIKTRLLENWTDTINKLEGKESSVDTAAFWYCANFGFVPFMYRGLETGNREVASHAIRQDKIVFIFESALLPDNPELATHLAQHGDGVKDICFEVDDLDTIVAQAKKAGAIVVADITKEEDDCGYVRYATVKTFGDTVHTLLEKKNYKGVFLPGYKTNPQPEEFFAGLPKVDLNFIDHCVANQPDGEMESAVRWYEKVLNFHRFWSIDDSVIHTEYSGLRSISVSNSNDSIKINVNEAANKKGISQIQEFVSYFGGAGVQHIALNTTNIVSAIEALRARGCLFLTIPDSYYVNLRERLANSKIKIAEDMDKLQKLRILVDFDENGYLLQIFSKPCQDRPTFFVEIIQRQNHKGFGAGNFKALFESIEIEQKQRGNLFDEKGRNGEAKG